MNTRWCRVLLTSTLLAGAGLARAESPAQPASPSGYFVLTSATGDRGATSTQLQNAKLAGISLRREWLELNPQDNVYDWWYLDREFEKAAAAGKKVHLRVLAGTHAPAWLYPAGARSMKVADPQEPGSSYTMPVPWDPVMLDRWRKLVLAMGARYGSSPQLVLVHMSGPSAFSAEMHLPDEVTKLQDWSPNKMVDAWRQAIFAYRDAFPTKSLSLNLATVTSNSDGIMEAVAAEAKTQLGPRAVYQHNALSAKTTIGFLPHQVAWFYTLQGQVTGYQMLCGSSDVRFGGKYQLAIKTAVAGKAKYIELYPNDVAKIGLGGIIPAY